MVWVPAPTSPLDPSSCMRDSRCRLLEDMFIALCPAGARVGPWDRHGVQGQLWGLLPIKHLDGHTSYPPIVLPEYSRSTAHEECDRDLRAWPPCSPGLPVCPAPVGAPAVLGPWCHPLWPSIAEQPRAASQEGKHSSPGQEACPGLKSTVDVPRAPAWTGAWWGDWPAPCTGSSVGGSLMVCEVDPVLCVIGN